MNVYYVIYSVSRYEGSYLALANGPVEAENLVMGIDEDYHQVEAYPEPINTLDLDPETCSQVIAGCIATDLIDIEDVQELMAGPSRVKYLECGS